ncbi:hypothetical protein CABS01_12588 [Colletotrichum abscissum]|uniref:Secreted protein n=1 Tax=Colletotrichum lupini TaxID=145971 RepID=A0A9Q8T0D0_9PEZI|nr:uncharacterized protein CLUP02_12365 [Colletotrichum lupini]XP_060396476.1 uncharacterized protein CABS01_12588 [Colletotrichum abscissum]KAK1490007.1 hypothetical protein CABS01_12588 [Colletotrichum abscissum]KAK1710106.1 hypothetical protein BDP67DRAFT_521741 [Colletotrichum lupini]UQC86863.1 hypothetical protein CLUP02_12365 [Colletotrichum lupini]
MLHLKTTQRNGRGKTQPWLLLLTLDICLAQRRFLAFELAGQLPNLPRLSPWAFSLSVPSRPVGLYSVKVRQSRKSGDL